MQHYGKLSYPYWWAHQDLNLGPLGYEPIALTAELWAPNLGQKRKDYFQAHICLEKSKPNKLNCEEKIFIPILGEQIAVSLIRLPIGITRVYPPGRST